MRIHHLPQKEQRRAFARRAPDGRSQSGELYEFDSTDYREMQDFEQMYSKVKGGTDMSTVLHDVMKEHVKNTIPKIRSIVYFTDDEIMQQHKKKM